MLKGQASGIRKINSWNALLPKDIEIQNVNTLQFIGLHGISRNCFKL